jgi:hypothetical protein
MGCGCSKSAKKYSSSNASNNPVRVETVTFYRSDEDGNANEQVDSVFFTTGFIFFF